MSVKTIKKISFQDTSLAFSLRSNAELRKSYFLFALMNQSWLAQVGIFGLKILLYLHFPVSWLVKKTIFSQFCGGENLQECNQTVTDLYRHKVGTILDYSVEGAENQDFYEKTTQKVIQTIEKSQTAPEKIPFTVFKISGIGSPDLLEIIQTDEVTDDEKIEFEEIKARVERITKVAAESKVKLLIDAEESWIQKPIDEFCYQAMEQYNKKEAIIFNTYQMYLIDRYEILEKSIRTAREKGYFLGVKLVRGAYMEKERQKAHEGQYCEPICPTKEATDEQFNKAVHLCLANRDAVYLCIGTHNEESCELLADEMQKLGINTNDSHFWFAQLLGMSDHISFTLSNLGYNVAKYVPFGPVNEVMPYLFRRATENSSFAGQSSREFLLLKKECERRKKHS